MGSQREAFLRYYGAMPDDELLRLATNRESLVPVARAVVLEELQRRGKECPPTPPKSDTASALKEAKYGAIAAFAQAGLTIVLAIMSAFGPLGGSLSYVRPNAVVDGLLFAFLGLMVWYKVSRVAAVSVLALYVGDSVFAIVKNGLRFGAVLWGVVFLWAFVLSIRGTFAYHAYQRPNTGTPQH
jgi:hypothetical protein